MAAPRSWAQYVERFNRSNHVSARGLMHLPCPFCAAPDFAVFSVQRAEAVMGRGSACAECGRGARAIYEHGDDGSVTFEIVQTSGDDPPDWLQPPPRREEAGDPPAPT